MGNRRRQIANGKQTTIPPSKAESTIVYGAELSDLQINDGPKN
jgi:hypothetical protein